MKRSKFTEEQIIGVLKEHEAGAKMADLAGKHGASEATTTTSCGPRSALDHLTPTANAANLSATCDRQRNPDQLRRAYVALFAPPQGVNPPTR